MQQSAAANAALRDRDIVQLLQDGERDAAFHVLVDRYGHKIFRLCCSILREPALAEDTAQESLLRIWKALPRYDQRAALSTWIYAIARNRCLTAAEKRRDTEAVEGSDTLQSPVSATAVPVETDQQATLLRELVDALPERYRRTLTLYYYEDRSVVQTALLLGVPQGTVKTMLFRARALLLERIAHLGLDDPLHWLQEPL